MTCEPEPSVLDRPAPTREELRQADETERLMAAMLAELEAMPDADRALIEAEMAEQRAAGIATLPDADRALIEAEMAGMTERDLLRLSLLNSREFVERWNRMPADRRRRYGLYLRLTLGSTAATPSDLPAARAAVRRLALVALRVLGRRSYETDSIELSRHRARRRQGARAPDPSTYAVVSLVAAANAPSLAA